VTHFYLAEKKKCCEIKRLKFRHDDCLPLGVTSLLLYGMGCFRGDGTERDIWETAMKRM
jgi:hypothetical protein